MSTAHTSFDSQFVTGAIFGLLMSLDFYHEFSPEFIAVFPSSDKLFSTKFLFSTIFSDIDEMDCTFFLATSSGDSSWKNPHPVSYTHLTLPTNREV